MSQSATSTAPDLFTVRRASLLAVFWYSILALISYEVSQYLLSMYTEGDQRYYTALYEALAGSPIDDVMPLQALHTGASEPIYGHLMWIGSAFLGVEKTVYISVFNAILTVLMVRYLSLNSAPIWLVPLFLTNYYFLVVMTSTERLKFALLMLLAVAVIRSRSRYVIAALAPAAHFQTLIFYASIIAPKVVGLLRKGSIKALSIAAVGVAAASAFVYQYANAISEKIAFYSEAADISGSLGTLVVIACGFAMVKRRMQFLLCMAPVAAAVAVLGGARVNMIGFMVLTHFVLTERRAKHPIYIAILAYLSFKSIGYISNVMQYGEGVPSL